jgi:tetratricopeptide (TPR) repeat protein
VRHVIALGLLATHASAFAEWRSFGAAEFTLLTDLEPARAAALIQHLAWFDQVTVHYIPPAQNPATPRLRIVVFAQRKSFERVVNQQHFAAYTQPGLADTTLVVGPDPSGDVIENSLHEYVHYRLRTQPIGYPMWYEEGMATLLSTASFQGTPTQPTASVGQRLSWRLTQQPVSTPPLQRLVGETNLDGWSLPRITGFYKQSARLLRFFLYGPQAGFTDYRDAVDAFIANQGHELFTTLGTTPAELTEELGQFNRIRSKPFERFDIEPPGPNALTRRTLSEDDVTLLWAQTAQQPNPQYARRLFRRLTKANPDDPRYWAWLSRATMQRSADDAERYLANARTLAPQHPEVLIQQAVLQMRNCPMDQSLACLDTWHAARGPLRQALRADPDHFEAILWLGITELYGGNPGGAISYLRIAHNRAPWSPRVNFHVGECLRLMGNPRAEAHLRQAHAWARDPDLKQLSQLALDAWHSS